MWDQIEEICASLDIYLNPSVSLQSVFQFGWCYTVLKFISRDLKVLSSDMDPAKIRFIR
jgi:hypothetical protein